MGKTNFLVVIALFTALVFSGFQCSSTELASARLYIQQKNYDKALNVLHKEVSQNPVSDEGWFLMGNVYGEIGKFDSLMIAFDKSLAISNKFEKEINQSKVYYWANSFNAGVSYFQHGNKTTDEDSAKVYYDKSIDAFSKATMLEPDSADAFRNLAFVYMNAGENEKAIVPLKKLIELKKELDGYKYLGEIYYALGSASKMNFKSSGNTEDSVTASKYFADAISVLEEGTKLYPEDEDILKTLSASYVETGKSNVALTTFKALVDKDPNNKIYRYSYGVLLLSDNNFEMAEQEFLKAIELDSEYTNAIYNLAVTYVKWGAALNKKSEESEEYSDAYKVKFEAALPYLEKLVVADKTDVDSWELLGKVYSVLGMDDKAVDAFNHADQLK